MGLKFVDAGSVRKSNLVLVVYGTPNVGKTTFSLTASSPLHLDFDMGVHRAVGKTGKRTLEVGPGEWQDLLKISESDVENAETIIIDTAGSCLESLMMYLISRDQKLRNASGQPTLAGYGALKAAFLAWVKNLKMLKKDIVIVAHVSEEGNMDDEKNRIVAMGASKQYIYQVADLMGWMHHDANGRRILTFDPVDSTFVKNVGTGIEKIEFGDITENSTCCADVIASGKQLINAEAVAMERESQILRNYKDSLPVIDLNADAYNMELDELLKREGTDKQKRMLVIYGRKQGLSFDSQTRRFITPAPAGGEPAGGEPAGGEPVSEGTAVSGSAVSGSAAHEHVDAVQ